MVRYSNVKDVEKIKGLLKENFGIMAKIEGAYDGIENGRYLVKELNGDIVSIAALTHDDEYNGIQLAWVCTAADHRHHGYAKELVGRLMASTDEDVYCSCWRVDGSISYMGDLLGRFGFKKVMDGIKARNIKYNCHICGGCPRKGDSCSCGNSLYLRSIPQT